MHQRVEALAVAVEVVDIGARTERIAFSRRDDDPHGVVTANDGVTPLRLCIFIQCLGGSGPEVTCPSGTVPATSPFARPGCCGTGEFDIDLNCAGTGDETSEIFMRVDNPSHDNVCVPYSLVWHC